MDPTLVAALCFFLNLCKPVLKIFDAEVMIYGQGFTQRSGIAEAETQCLYYAEMKIIIDKC